MRILILGGTGSIGGAVLDALIRLGHNVHALSRSTSNTSAIVAAGAIPISGDIRHPEKWRDSLKEIDAVIHAAATWGEDMDEVDEALVDALLEGLQTPDSSKTLIYTGGCWFFGNTGDAPATEKSPLCEAQGFSSAIRSAQKVQANSSVRGMVVHPAMVYERCGGVFERMYEDIRTLGHVRVFGDLSVRWPLVHRFDLAMVYVQMLSKGKSGDVFNASAIDGITIGDISRAITESTGTQHQPVVYGIEHAMREYGEWAQGFALDQLMSGEKARRELDWNPEHTDVFADIY